MKNENYKACLYLRLSKEDSENNESTSITNQRELIKQFVSTKEDITIVNERVDDGYSGTNFNRPEFQKMMTDIENNLINCVIVKDLSRLGRNFSEVSNYTEVIFPKMKVRLISVIDNYDSIKTRTLNENALLPFSNLMNEAYTNDISKKVNSTLNDKRKKGLCVSNFACYGYLKDPTDKNKLIIDEEASKIVKKIFNYKLDGLGDNSIADKLNNLGILAPYEYKKSTGSKFNCSFKSKDLALWSPIAINRILKNEVYIGNLVQGKERVRIENTHEPIIDKEVFNTIKKIISVDTRVSPKQKALYPYSGLLFCSDCNSNMIRNSSSNKYGVYVYYVCSEHKNYKNCSSHRISEIQLNETILTILKHHISNISNIEYFYKNFAETKLYIQEISIDDSTKIDKLKLDIAKYCKLKEDLYENLEDGLFDKNEYLDLKLIYDKKIEVAENELFNFKNKGLNNIAESDIDKMLIFFNNYKDLEIIDRKTAVTLIEKIIVFENKRIEIYFIHQDIYNLLIDIIKKIVDSQEKGDQNGKNK